MKEEKVFKFKMDEEEISLWYFKDEDDCGEEITAKNYEDIAKLLGFSPRILDTMLMLVDAINLKFDAMKEDMIDLYKKAEDK